MKNVTNKYLDARLGLVLGVGQDDGFMGRVAARIHLGVRIGVEA